MKLTKQHEEEARLIYELYWSSYLSGDVETFSSTLDDAFELIGTSESEVSHGKAEGIEFMKQQLHEVVGKVQKKNRKIQLIPANDFILINEQADIYISIESEWKFYGRLRLSSFIRNTHYGWKMFQQHGSLPDAQVQEGETIGLEQIKKENLQLRDAVKRRTVELEYKNRELEIETALERVRTVAMGMNKPDDMIEICRIISEQLQSLKIENIRNVQTAIINDEKGTYLNYEYFTQYNTTSILEILTELHPTVLEFVNEIKKSADAFFTTSFSGKSLDEWRKYRTKTNQNTDPLLETATSLHYYFYSIGKGAIGISAYAQLGEEHLKIFKRFRNVFDLAYRRFIDIQQAEAQARESQIELGLERVRARAMAMQKSDELSELVDTVFKELTKLDFALNWCIINIIDESSMSNTVWAANPDINEAPESYHMLFEDYPFHDTMMKGWKERKTKHVYVLEGEEKKVYDEYLFNDTEFSRVPAAAQAASRAMEKYVVTFTFSNFGGLQTVGEVPLSDANIDILSRFGKVFDLTYTRFNDLQKSEAQARESQIQLALERVRARTMAMQHSNELQEAAILLFDQVKGLGVHTGSCGFNIWNKKEKTATVWMSSAEGGLQTAFELPHTESPVYLQVYEEMKKGEDFLVKEVAGNNLKKHFDYLATLSGIGEVIKKLRTSGYGFPETMVFHFAFFSQGYLSFHLHEHHPETHELFKRFAKVFEQTYTRFLDLQKAEAQAREAQIEAALERVRSRSMGMQKSEELKEVIKIVYQQLTHLKINLDHAGFVVDYTPGGDWHFWIADEQDIPSKITHPYFESIWAYQFIEAKVKGTPLFATNLNFEEKNKFYNELLTYVPGLPEEAKDFYLSCPGLAASTVLLDSVALYIENFSGTPYTVEENETLMRFGNVFEQTYTRFLDLQKAEAQAREALIEVATERVRAQSMSMHQTGDLDKVNKELFNQLANLKVDGLTGVSINLIDENGFVRIYDLSSPGNMANLNSYSIKFDSNKYPILGEMVEVWKSSNQDYFVLDATKEKLEKAIEEFKEIHPEVAINFKNALESGSLQQQWNAFGRISNGLLSIDLMTPPSEDTKNIVLKMAGAFNMAFKRFQDLQKAEAQAREALIENALEKVRSRTMAMQHSDELLQVISVVSAQLQQLHFKFDNVSFAVRNQVQDYKFWFSAIGFPESYHIQVPYLNNPMFERVKNIQNNDSDIYADTLTQEENGQWLKHVFAHSELKKLPEPTKKYILKRGYARTIVLMPNIMLIVGNYASILYSEEDNKVFKRFATVFEQSYTRFQDLQKAEAQAKEAQIELALERVRAKAMAMNNSEELKFVASELRIQMGLLGQKDLEVCAIHLYEIDEDYFESWGVYQTPGSKGTPKEGLAKFPKKGIRIIDELMQHYREGKKDYILLNEGYKAKEWFEILKTNAPLAYKEIIEATKNIPFDQLKAFWSVADFSGGALLMVTISEPDADSRNLLRRSANVFELAYTRYLDLKKAEAYTVQAQEDLIKLQTEKKRAEDALKELKSTQAQLIQSEKMASLGELTAGIAHEIQNPLNFVNNFSEVSNELIAEMNVEIDEGNLEGAKEIAEDVKQNLEKILHHGKRADAIVKGMLLHSRSNTGVKEPTNINALADEYLRLAYHGLRAKDKSFNVSIQTDYDPTISKISIVRQDIGRALLNLITNAFYVVDEKKKLNPTGYEPIVSISTKIIVDKVEIKVADNGNGIPQKILDKIFQPFFTTKPTGQGTGLGLSLSYDIVKAHGGELKVETRENEGSQFIIQIPAK